MLRFSQASYSLYLILLLAVGSLSASENNWRYL